MRAVRPVPYAPLGEEEQFRRLVESVTDYAIFVLDREGRVQTWNPGAQRIKGYAAEEILGRPFTVFYPPEAIAAELPQRLLDQAAREGRAENEGWRVRRDGSRFWANCVLTPIRDADGALVGYAKVTRDLTERRNALLAAEQQNRQLRAVLDCMSDAVAVCDREGRFIHLNQAARALVPAKPDSVGALLEEAPAHGIFELDGATPFPLHKSTLLRALQGEESSEAEVVVRNAAHPDGLFVSISSRSIRDQEGQIVAAVLVARDVTRRKRTELDLERQSVLLKSVLDCVVEAVAVYDLEGRMILSNPAFSQFAGKKFEPNAGVQERFEQYGLFTADGERRLTPEESPASRAVRGEVVSDLEFLMRSPAVPEGRVISTNAQRLLSPAGQVLGAVVTGRDVTARKVAEQKLVEQKRLLSSILDCLGEAVFVYDLVGHILLTNASADRLRRHLSREGATFAERSQPNSLFTADGSRELPLSESAVGRALRGESVDDLEVLVRTPALPEGVPLSTTARPLRDRNGQIVAAVSTIRDISARRAAESERERLLAELHRSNVELSQFAYVASHDLRAPLRAIDSLASWLQEDLGPHFTAETGEQMRLLRSRVNRMDGLLRDLLEFSRLGRADFEVERVDVERLVNEVIDLVGLPRSFLVVLEVEAAPFETASLPLKRVLMNLLANAAKHHDRAAGEIHVSVRERGTFVEIEVRDDGPGIPADYHGKIFEMFQTLKPRDSLEGSGMGLAFVKKIVDGAGGTVAVESAGRGASFRVHWPRVWRSAVRS